MTNQTSKITATGSGATFKVEPLPEQAEIEVRAYWGNSPWDVPQIDHLFNDYGPATPENWLAAKAYTDEHRRKRQELDRNIAWVMWAGRHGFDTTEQARAYSRVLESQQQALSAHIRGVREGI